MCYVCVVCIERVWGCVMWVWCVLRDRFVVLYKATIGDRESNMFWK